MFIYALRRLTWLKSSQIAHLAGRTPGAVTHALKSIEQRLKNNRHLAARVQELYSAPELKRGK